MPDAGAALRVAGTIGSGIAVVHGVLTQRLRLTPSSGLNLGDMRVWRRALNADIRPSRNFSLGRRKDVRSGKWLSRLTPYNLENSTITLPGSLDVLFSS